MEMRGLRPAQFGPCAFPREQRRGRSRALPRAIWPAHFSTGNGGADGAAPSLTVGTDISHSQRMMAVPKQ